MFSHARILFAVVIAAAGVAMAQTKTPEWKEIDQLLSERKVQAALDGAELRLKSAIAKNDEGEHARALIRVTQMRLGLHGYETAVRVLREQPWPKGAAARTPVVLYYANTLVTYARAYGWEIRQRERVEAKGPVDLKAWTLEQIYTEAQRSFDQAWSRRADLGTQKNATLEEYLTDSTYPAGIRDTLRDTLSYLRVQFLADTNAWLPEQSNELYKLDLPALIKGDARTSGKLSLSDPQLHPLQRIGAVLDDLEAWHLGAGRKESALEARLERVRQLSARFADADDRALFEKDLQARLPSLKALPWFSMGQAQLAEWIATHDLVKARAVAQEGAAAHPTSIGGQRCAAKVAAIEAPDYGLTAMAVDAPGKRSVQISHKNLRALYFRVYPMDLDKRIATAQDYNLLPNSNELRVLLKGKPESAWTVELPATPDFKTHQTFVTPKLSRSGLYLVAASVKQDFSEPENRILAVNLVAGDLVLTETSEANAGLDVNVWSAASGQPVAGAQIRLYQYDWQKKHQLIDTQASDAKGLARFKYESPRTSRSYFLVAKKGEEVTLDVNALAFTQREPPPERYGSLVYTDRSIYRPLQKILWKTVVYRAAKEGTRFDAAPEDRVTVSLMDPNGQVVEKKDATTNEFGSAAGEFTVPTGRLLGNWTLTTSRSGASSVRVEEYKRPTFEVSIKDPTGALRLNKPAVLTGEARYDFGLPVTSAKVVYRVTRVPVF
ncbi:MAG: MG2 domain-containing protein, partial [Myxococcaceae bacterium]